MEKTLLLALAVCLAPAASADDAPDNAMQARITSVQGDVFVYYKDAPDDAITADKDDPLEPGDRVLTGVDGRADLSLDGESLIELGGDSDFEVGTLERKTPVFTLSLGSLLAKIKSMASEGGQLSINTPTAVAAVRGTEFGVDVEQDDKTSVGVFDEGKVAVQAAGGEQTLAPNQETSVAQGGPPARPGALKRFKARRQRLKNMRRRLQTLSSRWQRLNGAALAARRRLAIARANRASPARRAALRKRLRRLRQRRKNVNQRRAALRGKVQAVQQKQKN